MNFPILRDLISDFIFCPLSGGHTQKHNLFLSFKLKISIFCCCRPCLTVDQENLALTGQADVLKTWRLGRKKKQNSVL